MDNLQASATLRPVHDQLDRPNQGHLIAGLSSALTYNAAAEAVGGQ